jgi:hypothetical protein
MSCQSCFSPRHGRRDLVPSRGGDNCSKESNQRWDNDPQSSLRQEGSGAARDKERSSGSPRFNRPSIFGRIWSASSSDADASLVTGYQSFCQTP